jgi:hypothetical protein
VFADPAHGVIDKSRPARDPAVGRRYGSWDVARCRADSDELVHDSASRQRYDQQHADYIDVVCQKRGWIGYLQYIRVSACIN